MNAVVADLKENTLGVLQVFEHAYKEVTFQIKEIIKGVDMRMSQLRIGVIFAIIIIIPISPFLKIGSNSVLFIWTYWIFLGFLSSCGFGSGLHTFTLYLSPLIAKTYMKSQECGSTQFKSPPYPWEFHCSKQFESNSNPNIWEVFWKLFKYSFLWGFGTALGELPPYLFSRSLNAIIDRPIRKLSLSRNSVNFAKKFSDEDIDNSQLNRAKHYVNSQVAAAIKNWGFWGIFLMASVPNPLFDLAGVASGHFGVPLSTFLVATIAGKSLIKSSLQTLVLLFSLEQFSAKSQYHERFFDGNPKFKISLNVLQYAPTVILLIYIYSVAKELALVWNTRVNKDQLK